MLNGNGPRSEVRPHYPLPFSRDHKAAKTPFSILFILHCSTFYFKESVPLQKFMLPVRSSELECRHHVDQTNETNQRLNPGSRICYPTHRSMLLATHSFHSAVTPILILYSSCQQRAPESSAMKRRRCVRPAPPLAFSATPTRLTKTMYDLGPVIYIARFKIDMTFLYLTRKRWSRGSTISPP